MGNNEFEITHPEGENALTDQIDNFLSLIKQIVIMNW